MNDKHIKTSAIKWEEIQSDVFEKQCIVNKHGLNISVLKIEPYKKIPLHKHSDTRYNYILKGSMSDGKKKYNTGEIIVNKKGSEHFLKAGSRGCEFLLIWD